MQVIGDKNLLFKNKTNSTRNNPIKTKEKAKMVEF